MANEFQGQVNILPAIGVPGQHMSTNPLVSTQKGYCAADAVTIGGFVWAATVAENDAFVKSTGKGAPLGFAVREITNPLGYNQPASNTVPKGFPVSVAVKGDFAVITGCLKIAKESIFTGLNNFKVYSITNTEFDETFGFTDEEVKIMLHDYEMDDRYDEVKEWYDGYRFGKADVYCPWDVVNYCNDHIHNPAAEPENYWMNTSGNSVIHHFIDSINEPDMLTKTELEWLVNGKTVIKQIDEMVTYNDLYSTMDHLWSTLFMTGYLTQRGRESDGRYCLAIPNREIRNIITERILTLFQQEVKKDGKMAEQFCQALLGGKSAEVESLLNLYLQKTVSVRDTFVRKSLKENFYHGILLGILSYKNDWRVSSNRESGEGFSDIVIETGDAETGIVIEVKYTDEKKDLERDCRKALEQIRDKDYTQTLWQEGYKKMVWYGIAFHLKQCCVMKEEMQRKRNRDGALNRYNLL